MYAAVPMVGVPLCMPQCLKINCVLANRSFLDSFQHGVLVGFGVKRGEGLWGQGMLHALWLWMSVLAMCRIQSLAMGWATAWGLSGHKAHCQVSNVPFNVGWYFLVVRHWV